jgi:hypothetical protein
MTDARVAGLLCRRGTRMQQRMPPLPHPAAAHPPSLIRQQHTPSLIMQAAAPPPCVCRGSPLIISHGKTKIIFFRPPAYALSWTLAFHSGCFFQDASVFVCVHSPPSNNTAEAEATCQSDCGAILPKLQCQSSPQSSARPGLLINFVGRLRVYG